MKNDAMTRAVLMVRGILRDGGRLRAVRYLRSLGLTYTTASQMVIEIRDGARWYRSYK